MSDEFLLKMNEQIPAIVISRECIDEVGVMLTMKQNLIVNLFLVDVKLFLGIAVIPAQALPFNYLY